MTQSEFENHLKEAIKNDVPELRHYIRKVFLEMLGNEELIIYDESGDASIQVGIPYNRDGSLPECWDYTIPRYWMKR